MELSCRQEIRELAVELARLRSAAGEVFQDQGSRERFLGELESLSTRAARQPEGTDPCCPESRKEAAEQLRELVSGLSHELNQPLCAIGNYATAARLNLRDEPSNAIAREYLCRIEALVLRASEIVRRLAPISGDPRTRDRRRPKDPPRGQPRGAGAT